MSTFVSAQALRDDIYHGHRQTVLGVFWEPEEGAGHRRFESEHVPTALFCDPAYALAGIPSSEDGRNPLPEPHHLQDWFRRWGLAEDSRVVVYDEGRGPMAARAWWILRWAGMTDVRILDGGLRAWDSLNLPIVGGPGNFATSNGGEVRAGSLPVAGIDEVRDHLAAGGVLVDARDSRRFAGRREILDLKAGHIPGAVNIPAADLYDENRVVCSPEEIRARFARESITSGEGIIVYSGSGNHSAMLLAAMERAGLGVASHYVCGWSQWSADPENPVERGV
ncbi:sulfurtransferase [Corynebacterium comes]|uniref:3-mercaptopyruvate sulfurtransferase n=1 Tax=Corynebacterium comes TaxID=2675218 RepID=A0A6B8W3Y2_9CORY|nr:sulfurtransferase [Corynebacterium comes]QGU05636.1 3-mercaptopyruvate sulfurtransferase [Corynebacterium comes]